MSTPHPEPAAGTPDPRSGYVSPLASRNASPEMQAVWSPRRKFGLWRRIWLAVAEAEHELGLPVTAAQVEALLDTPAAPANLSLAMRAREDLTHQWFGYPSMRDNASSLMLRRETVDELGPFLPVRKGADTEYAERVRAPQSSASERLCLRAFFRRPSFGHGHPPPVPQ